MGRPGRRQRAHWTVVEVRGWVVDLAVVITMIATVALLVR